MTTKQTPTVAAVSEETNFVASQASSVSGIYGLTGAGKTSLAVTAAEYAWEVYKAVTLMYCADLGGFGNKALSLIKLGILRVWYVRNHVMPFDTMELATMGWWPEALVDPFTGMAAADCRLIAPYRSVYTMLCKNGHSAAQAESHAEISAVSVVCTTCGELVHTASCLRIDRTRVRSKGFKHVGLRIYDSFSALNEWALDDLTKKSAAGQVGEVLSSADALRETGSQFAFGTSSRGQYGFTQNRNAPWIGNIRAIPDQKVPAIATFLVEQSKGDDESGGQPMFGPKIAGNARTSTVPQWLGNCLYAAMEPSAEAGGEMRHRLWLTTHVDPRDARAIPYVAKHRGEPLGMPSYLEDSGKPEEAWDRCSLKVFFRLLDEQQVKLEARDSKLYPDAPGMAGFADDSVDEVLSTAPASGAEGMPASLPTPAGGRIARPGGRTRTLRKLETAVATEQAIVATEEKLAAMTAPAAAVPTAAATTDASSPVVEQLTASLAERTAAPADTTASAAAPVPAARAAAPQAPPPGADAVTSEAPPPVAGPRRVVRRARPPVSE